MSCTTTLTTIGEYVRLTQNEPFRYVTAMAGWSETISGIGQLKREFRWGITNLRKASWIELTTQNLQGILLNPAKDLYVDFRFTLIGGGPITIDDIQLEYTQTEDALDPYLGYHPPMLVSERGNISNLTKIENFTFKPYEVNPAVVLYKELSSTINKLFGQDVMYARAIPLTRGKDVVLHEWTLYDVDDPCCVKVLVPNNEFPDSKINFNPFGLDFEIPFEVHIVKEYFEEVFGVGTAPQKRDIVYFGLTNRIYEVESSYLWKDIMQKEVYWKVSLKKYAPKSNRYEPSDLREQFDSITRDTQEEFGAEVESETLQLTKPQQFGNTVSSRDYDPIRQSVNDTLVITQAPLRNWSNILSESQYDLRSIFVPGSITTAVTYRAFSTFAPVAEEERALLLWFKDIKSKIVLPKDPLKGAILKGPAGATTTPIAFNIAPKRTYTTNTALKVTRFNGLTLYGQFTSSTPVPGVGFTIAMDVRNEIIEYLDVHYPGWASPSTNSGYHVEPTEEKILMDGYDASAQQGWKLSTFAGRFFVFKSTYEDIIFILQNNLVEDFWYALVFNVSNQYAQISLDLWVRKWNDTSASPQQTTNLENIFSKAVLTTVDDRSAPGKYPYRIPASNTVCTNIRLLSACENDQTPQMTLLNQTILQDSQFAIIVDNALPVLRLPFIAKSK